MFKKAVEYREAAVRRQESTTQEHFFDTNVPKRTYDQKRLSIFNWNPGPRRGKEGAFEKQIAGKWHIITLQEAIDYVDHELRHKQDPCYSLRRLPGAFQQRHLLP